MSFRSPLAAIRARDFLHDVFYAIGAAANRARSPFKLPFSPDRTRVGANKSSSHH